MYDVVASTIMNTTQPQSPKGPSTTSQKDRVTKTLAIVGFLATISIIAWLIFTTISSIPNIVASVASLFTNDEMTLQIESGTTELLSGERTTITWNDVDQAGSFAFAYTCEEGLEVDLMTPEYGTQALSCDRYYSIGELTSVNLTARSTQNERVTLTYQVGFTPEANPDAFYPSEAFLTVTNPNLVALTDEEVVEDEPVQEEETVTEPETEDTSSTQDTDSSTSTDTTTTPPAVQYQEEIIYALPVSNPSGFTDLSIRLNSNGYLRNQTTFVPSGSISRNQTGAIQFVVKNNGTRTSETWTYTAVLPNGQVYESPVQTALRPNEEATITLGFRPPNTSGWYDYTVDISTSRDSNRANHQISWGVAVN